MLVVLFLSALYPDSIFPFFFLSGPACNQLVDPTKAYKSAAFEVSEQELVFDGGGYKNLVAVEKQKTLGWLVDSDEEEDMPEAGSLLKNSKKGEYDEEKVTLTPELCSESSLKVSFSFRLLNSRQHKASTSSTLIPETSGFSASIPRDELTFASLQRWKNPKMPSTKLVALVDMLKGWRYNTETAMDKVIIYSQCKNFVW